MTTQRPFPRLVSEDDILDGWLKAVADEFDRRRLVDGVGISIDQFPSGTIISAADQSPGFIHVKIGSTAVSPATSATQMTSGLANVWTADGTGLLTDSLTTITVWNKSTLSTFAANTHYGAEYDGSGLAILTWSDCGP